MAAANPSYLVWTQTGGAGCEATYRTRWVRSGAAGTVEELGAVDKLVLAGGSDVYEVVSQCELRQQTVDCMKELGADMFEAVEAPPTDTYDKTFIHLGLRSVSTGATVDAVSGKKYLTLKQPITQAAYDEATPLKSYADTVLASAGTTLFVASRTRDYGDPCGMQGNGFTDEASTLMTPIGSQGRAKEPKYTSIPKALEAAANKEAARACFDCVKSVTETPDEGDCKDEKAERVSTVSPRFVDGVLKASWALLVPVPVGVCRETDDHMFIYVESDTLPAEWGVPTTPAIVTKALAETGSATLSKSGGSTPTGDTPMGWTEVTPEIAAAGQVAKAFGG